MMNWSFFYQHQHQCKGCDGQFTCIGVNSRKPVDAVDCLFGRLCSPCNDIHRREWQEWLDTLPETRIFDPGDIPDRPAIDDAA